MKSEIKILEEILEQFKNSDEEKAIVIENVLKKYKKRQKYSKEYYEKNKERINRHTKEKYAKEKENNSTYYQRNRDRIRKYQNEWRKNRVKKLSERGIINAWGVANNAEKPIYKILRRNDK